MKLFFDNQLFHRVMLYMRPRIYKYYVGMFGMAVLFSATSIIEAFTLKYISQSVYEHNIQILQTTAMVLILAFIIILVSTPIFRYLYNWCSNVTSLEARKDIFKKRGGLPFGYFNEHSRGSFLNILTHDTYLLTSLYTGRLRKSLYPFIYGCTALIPMLILDYRITICLILFNSLFAYINSTFRIPIKQVSYELQKKNDRSTSSLIELLSANEIVKMYNIKGAMLGLYKEALDDNAKLANKKNRLDAMLIAINNLMGLMSTIGFLMIGMVLVTKNITDFGSVIAIYYLQGRLSKAFLEVGLYIPDMQASLVGAERVLKMMDDSSESNSGEQIVDVQLPKQAEIKLRDISFRYYEGKNVLNNLTLAVYPGEKIAIVGPSGCGKSTLCKLLIGLYVPNEGTIHINGKLLDDRSIPGMRNLISYIPQDSFLFNDTIKENIRYGSINSDNEQIVNAGIEAMAHEFIHDFPDGYDTKVGAQGNSLSGGQKQRIAIARALNRNAAILLWDEPTASLDLITEESINNLIRSKKVTSIVITHRIKTVQHFDRIYVMDNGEIIEAGSHTELIENRSVYYNLYQSQICKVLS